MLNVHKANSREKTSLLVWYPLQGELAMPRAEDSCGIANDQCVF